MGGQNSEGWGLAALTGGLSLPFTADKPTLPEPPGIPPPVEDVDVQGQKQYTKEKLKSRKGRQSTLLASLGSNNNTSKKTILG